MQAMILPFVLCMCFFPWSLGKQSCDKNLIERPENVDLSSVDPTTESGKSVRLRCASGYTGFHRASCENGDWTISGRGCQKKPCGHPGDTSNGDFNLVIGEDFVFGAVVEYTCKTGYRMMSRINQRSCLASGWDNDVPVCEVVKCPVIKVAGNIRASGDVEDASYGDVIHFECLLQDMKLYGDNEIHCTDEGLWSSTIPTCKEIQCEKPDIPHGTVTSRETVFRNHDTLRYTCDESYKAPEGQSPRCTKYGWTPKPECEEIRCRLQPVSTEKTLPEGKNTFRPLDEVEVFCREGYRTSTKKQSDSFVCREDGTWENSPDCLEIECRLTWGGPVKLHRLDRYPYSYKYTYKYNETLKVDCQNGYRKTVDYVKCELEAWNPEAMCVRAGQCIPPTIENGYVVERTKDTTVFSCNPGFKLNTKGWWKKSSCSGGLWSATPKCIAQSQCAAPPTADNVIYQNVKDIYSNGDSQEFQCILGASRLQIKCDNGEWEKPQCQEESDFCPAPPDVENGIIVSPYQKFYRNHIEVKYECRELHKMEGNDKIMCSSGTWDDPPICLSPCDAPIADDSVDYISVNKSYSDGEDLQFECKPGYTSELQQIKCRNGTWDNPSCTRDTNFCITPPMIKNGKILNHRHQPSSDKNIYTNGFELKYKCDNMYNLDGSDTITCNSGSWTNPPTCKLDESAVTVYGLVGQNVILPCKYDAKQYGSVSICWGKGQLPITGCNDEVIQTLGLEVKDRSSWRYQLSNRHSDVGDVSLTVFDAIEQDSGTYGCRVRIPGWFNDQKTHVDLRIQAVPAGACGPPPQESFAVILHQSGLIFYHGTEVEFQCPTYYIWEGAPRLLNGKAETPSKGRNECLDGKWQRSFRCLKPCIMSEEAMDERNIQFKVQNLKLDFVEDGDYITFVCKYQMIHDYKDDMRQKCTDGHMTLPKCH